VLYFKNLKGFEYALITNGGASVYGTDGGLKQLNIPLEPKLMQGAIKVEGISIVTYNGMDYEVATEDNNGLVKYIGGNLDSARFIQQVMMERQFICQLKSQGKAGNTRYRQHIFIFPENFNVRQYMQKYNMTEIQ
jgi:hypothetical protein